MAIQGYVDIISLSEVSGWALDWDAPATGLEISIIANGSEVGRCKADAERPGLRAALGNRSSGSHAFKYRFERPLDSRDNHHIEVRASIAGVLLQNGRRTLYRPNSGHSRFTPIFLTSSGRSGTTMLMQEFVTHPDIAVANAYPFEFKLASYYASAWHVLAASTYAPTETEKAFSAHACRDLVIGRNPWNRPELLQSVGGCHAARLIGQSFSDRLADLFKAIVEESYGAVADRSGKSARFFAEKATLEEPVRQACRILFGSVKEVVLVRDPRDYICSAIKFWKRGVEDLIATMGSELPTIMKIFAQKRPDVLFIRYEDLILDTAATRKRLYDFLGCDADFVPRPLTVDKVPATHRTSNSPAESIGRYRTELDSRTQQLCGDAFTPFMTMFDYAPNPPPVEPRVAASTAPNLRNKKNLAARA